MNLSDWDQPWTIDQIADWTKDMYTIEKDGVRKTYNRGYLCKEEIV